MVSLSVCWGLLHATRGVEPRGSLKVSETSHAPSSCAPRVAGSQPPSPRGPGMASLPEEVTPAPALPARAQGTQGRAGCSGGSGHGAGPCGAPGQKVGRDQRLQPACEEQACICSTWGSRRRSVSKGVRPPRLRSQECCLKQREVPVTWCEGRQLSPGRWLSSPSWPKTAA